MQLSYFSCQNVIAKDKYSTRRKLDATKKKKSRSMKCLLKETKKKKRTIIQQTAIGEVQTLVRVVTFPGGEALETFLSLSTNK